jgi:DNA-binding LacI/PurR family transcriptional regulator
MTPSSRRFDGAARIGVVTLHGASRHISEGILGGVVSASESGGLAVSLIDVVVQNNDTAGAIRRAVDSHLAEAVAGLVVVATHAAVRGAVQNAATGIPIVLALADDDRVASVTIDSYNGAVQATRYLLALGHTNLAHVAGPRSLTHAQARTRGFLDTLAEVGLEPVAVIDGDWTAKSGVVAGVELRETEATAVFCASDQLALGLMHAYTEVDRPAPDGISVVGYDDEDGAAFFSPTLTTIRQDYSAVGKRAYAVLQELIVDGRPRHAELIPELIVRGSTKRHSS